MSKVIARLAALAAGLVTLAIGAPAAVAQDESEWQAPSPIPEAFVAYNSGDFAEALRIWQGACDAGNPQGCYHAAIVHRDGEGVPVDPAKATERFEQACEGGVGNACFNLGIAASGEAQIAYFREGCSFDNVGSCARLGMAYSTGDGVIQDNAKAVEYLSRACEVREMFAGPACFMIASLYDIHADEMVEDNPAKANHWLEMGCRRGDLDSCQNLAWHYAHGFGLRTDFMRSAALYQFACGDNAGLECFFIPTAHRASGEYRGREVERRWREAGGAYDRACKADFAHGCFALARLISRGGKGAEHAEKMRELLGKAIALDPDHIAAIELLRRLDAGELPTRPIY